jgi:hypothetical protein
MERNFNRAAVGLMIGAPVAWAFLLLLHPTGDGDDFYPVVADNTTDWLVVHVGTLVFVPLMAAAIYVLLNGLEGTAARVSRIALGFFVVFYLAFEVLVGIGTGLFVDEGGEAQVVEDFVHSTLIVTFEMIGTAALLVALTAAGIALRREAGAPLAVPILLVLAAIPISWHVPPFGQVGLALFIAAVILVVREHLAPVAIAEPPRPA